MSATDMELVFGIQGNPVSQSEKDTNPHLPPLQKLVKGYKLATSRKRNTNPNKQMKYPDSIVSRDVKVK